MGTQNKWERMPLPPQNIPPRIASHSIPSADDARWLSLCYRTSRDTYRDMSGAQLVNTLNFLRRNIGPTHSYTVAVFYRSALNEAVVSRHWTVEWSALTNTHTIK